MAVTPLPSQPSQGQNPWYSAQVAWQNGVATNIGELDTAITNHDGATKHVPSGGSGGQVLRKINATNYNTEWATINTGSPWQVYSVFDYGAVGNGSTDDGPAIQSAVDAAASSSANGTVRLGRLHAIATEVVIPRGVRIEGQGSHQTLVYNTFTTGSSTKWPFSVADAGRNGTHQADPEDPEYTTYDRTQDKSGAQFADFCLVSSTRATVRNGIRIRRADDLLLDNVEFKYLSGTALQVGSVGSDATYGVGAVRESEFNRVRIYKCGSTNTPGMIITSNSSESSDGTNQVYFNQLRYVYNHGGILIQNLSPSTTLAGWTGETVRRIVFTDTQLHGLSHAGTTPNHDLVVIEGNVISVYFHGLVTNGSGLQNGVKYAVMRLREVSTTDGLKKPSGFVVTNLSVSECAGDVFVIENCADFSISGRANMGSISGNLVEVKSGSECLNWNVDIQATGDPSAQIVIAADVLMRGTSKWRGIDRGAPRYLIYNTTTSKYPPRNSDTGQMFIWMGTGDPTVAANRSTGSTTFQNDVDIWIDTN